MKKIFFICFLVIILNLSSCESNDSVKNEPTLKKNETLTPKNEVEGTTENEIPIYSLIGDNNSIKNIKYSIKIKINEKLSESYMRKILDKIITENPNYERYFIEHYLKEDGEKNYYATSHYEVNGSEYTFNIREEALTTTPKKEGAKERTDIEIVKKDIKNVAYKNTVTVTKEGNTLVISITEKEDHPLIEANGLAVANYTDWITENIKSDIKEIDISVIRPNSNVRAILDMSKLKSENGGYFDENYIEENILPK